jgi:hypothetical protein
MGIFNDPPLEPWQAARCDALRALEKAERLHDAARRLCIRAEQANIRHEERELDEKGQPAGKTSAMQQIELDEENRRQERSLSVEASFGRAMEFALSLLGGIKRDKS